MDRGLYTAASNMLAQQRAMDAAANNVANANTVGYRRTIPVFRGFQMAFAAEIARSPSHQPIGVPGGGATLDETYRDSQPGGLRPTGRPLDVALEGPGYFTVETPRGLRYTRAGNFQLNARNQLVTAEGHPVLGFGGPIVIDGTDVRVRTDGTVEVDGRVAGRLQIVEFPEPQRLLRAGHTQFLAPPEVERTRLDATGTGVRAGYLENANLNVVEELVRVINAQRSYELAARSIRTIDRTLGVAVRDIAQPA